MSVKTISYSAVVANLLAYQRKMQGLEQADVAARLGIAPSSYSRIETGQTALTIDALFSIAAVLGLDVAEMIRSAQHVIAKAQSTPAANVQVVPMARSNIKGVEGAEESNGVGPFVTGAALGALIGALLASGK